jgi:alkylation response protein AidB-like acyl-CoA dehydrogenase
MISADDLSSIEMIRQSAAGMADRKDLARIRAVRFASPGFDRAVWRQMCDAGWPALRLPESRGGAGLGLLPYCALMEELGAALAPEPLIPAILATALLEGETLHEQISGERLTVPAWQDEPDALSIEKPLEIENGMLTAVKLYVAAAEGADAFLVVGASEAACVPGDARGVEIASQETQDGSRLATVSFHGVAVEPYRVDPAPALAEAALATAAYCLGLMEAALDLTIDYLRTRIQFGRTIGAFQALQHMAVDARLEVELTRASVEAAAAEWDRTGPNPVSLAAVSRAKARASQAAMKVTRDAIQLHGGIGFTDEHDIGLYLRKAMVVTAQFGGPKAHRARFADLKPARLEA